LAKVEGLHYKGSVSTAQVTTHCIGARALHGISRDLRQQRSRLCIMNVCFARRPLTGVLAFLAAMAGAEPITSSEVSLSMTVDPSVSFAPAELRVRLDVTPSARNRSLVVVAESEDFYRSSEMPLAAEEAPRSVTVQFRGLPRGDYSVSGEIRDVDGRPVATVHQEIRVLAFQ